MRKSSLGRRSSIPVRVPSLGGSSAQRTCSGGKKSLLRPPGFTQTQAQKSRSEDRESCGGRRMSGNRASSVGRNLAVQTPFTPLSVHSNLPQSSTRPARALTMSTDSNRRASSIGGKNSRKDSRPITEKAFQVEALAKVQAYFDNHPTDFLSPGQSIRQITVKLFIDIIDFLIKKFDPRKTFTKSNYIEELIPYLKKINYRSKVDKSWLITVNTAHSWPHVIALLSWLVDAIEIMNAVDPLELLYPPNIDDDQLDEDDGDQVPLDKDCFLYLKKSFWYKDDPNKDAILDSLNEEYVKKEIAEQGIQDENIEIVETEVEKLSDLVEQETQRRNELVEAVKQIKQHHSELLIDCESMEKFIEQSEAYAINAQAKLNTVDSEIKLKQSVLAKEQGELKELLEKLNAQQFTVEDKEKMADEKRDLHRMIQYHENEIREYEKSAFPVDLDLAKDQKKLQDLILDYNKTIAEKLVEEPRLRDLEMKFTLMTHNENVSPKLIDEKLQELKEEFKGAIYSAEQKIDAAKQLLKSVAEQVMIVEENISKETERLDAIKRGFKTRKDSDEKKIKSYREEISHYEALSKQIDNEMSRLDTTSLDDQENEYKTIRNEIDEVKRRCTLLMGNVLQRIEESDKQGRAVLDQVNTLVNEAEEMVEK